jgi:hypothetical protein
LCVLSLHVQGANPDRDWRTHETKNFLIHYPNNLARHVAKVERYSEKSHSSLSEFFQWQPKAKTHVVLIDDFDQSNGYAQPMPNNTMTLFVQPPTAGELLVYDDWLKMLIHHEYTHILHMDKVLGFPSLLRKVFGRVFFTFPNALHPNWFAEGLATYQETDSENNVGRGQSTLFDIMMRSEFLSGLKPLSRINTVASHDWPLNTAYLYGVYFFKFIHDVYGESAIKNLINNYSDNVVPYRVGSNSIAVVGKDLDALWVDFDRYLKGYFEPQVQRIHAEEENRYAVISHDKESYGLLAKQDESIVWYSATDRQAGAGLYKNDQGVESRVVSLNSLAAVDVSNQGRVLVSQLEYCDQYSQYYDLYILNDDASLKRITECGRYRHARWLNEGEILALRYDGAKPILDILNADGQIVRSFWEGQVGVVVSAFDVEVLTDSSLNIMATIKFLDDDWNIYEFKQSAWKALTKTKSVQSNLSIDGASIVYTQAQIGQSEAYRLDLNGVQSRLTHTHTGIKQFIPINDDSSWALRYSPDGYQVVRVETSNYAVLYEELNQASDLKAPKLAVIEQDDLENSDSYSATKSMLPSYWFPVYLADIETEQIGFFTSGADALNVQQYTFQLVNEGVSDKFLVNASYVYDNRVFAGLQQNVDFILDNGSDNIYRKTSQWVLGAMKPFVQYERQIYPFVAITQSDEYYFIDEGNRSDVFIDNWLAFGVIYDQFKSTYWSGDIASGFQIKSSVETTDLVGSNEQKDSVLNFDLRVYTALPRDHTLAQRLFLAAGLDGDSNFQLGGSVSDPYIGPGIQVKQRRHALRGYSSGSDKLRGGNVLLHSLEYRLPIDWRDFSFMAPPIGFNGWSLRGFLDTGSAWDDRVSDARFYSGLGAEAILDVSLGYYLGLRVRIGAAKGFGSEAGDSIYLELGGAF